jgi:acyl-CoA reductase-like NAD-dependent aldehyde dehydrogenase
MLDRARANGCSTLFPLGLKPSPSSHPDAAWFPPVIVIADSPEAEIVQEETFGPILVVQTARDWHHALALCNGVRQGLAAALFTASEDHIASFLDEAQAGILKLNTSTADAAVDAPFGGWKASGSGPAEHGTCDIEFYTRIQSVYHSPQPPS